MTPTNMTPTKKWWVNSGYMELSQVIAGASPQWGIRLIESGIGDVPLSNLISIPSVINLSELTEIIKKEGLKATEYCYSNDKKDADILLRF